MIVVDEDGELKFDRLTEAEDMAVARFMAVQKVHGWENALTLYGLGAFTGGECTVRNDGNRSIRLPIGRREAMLDLEPGESVSIRRVEPDMGE